MDLPPEIISKIMTYHSNIKFSKAELLNYVEQYQKYLKCIECELYGDIDKLFKILYTNKSIDKRFFKWVDPYDWTSLYKIEINIFK